MGFTAFAKKAAPWITTIASVAVPGAAPFLGIASKLLTNGLGATVKADPQSIQDALTTAMANPEQLATLKKIDDDFAVQMRQLGIQEAEDFVKIAADDTANARAREIAVKDSTPHILAFSMVLLAMVASCIVLSGRSPAMKDVTQATLVGVVIGYIFGEVKQIFSYYFGSSAGSDRKTELLAEAPAIQK
jgi:hypothetical protein